MPIGKTLYLWGSEDCYIHADRGAIRLKVGDVYKDIPYGSISDIIVSGHTTLSVPFMDNCAKHNITVQYLDATGRYMGSFMGNCTGNVKLRKKQFDMLDDTDKSCRFVRAVLTAKLLNSARTLRDFAHHGVSDDVKNCVNDIVARIKAHAAKLCYAESIDDMRIIEANAARDYFLAFAKLNRSEDAAMQFNRRTYRPPLDNVNALLSYFYSIMTSLCNSSLMCAGLDPECGYLHGLRPGRHSLACDLVEEFRSPVVDRFVLRLINRKEVSGDSFVSNNDGIRITDDARRKILGKWQDYLSETTVDYSVNKTRHLPFRQVVFEQGMQLARFIRGDIEDYPAYYSGISNMRSREEG